MKKRFVIIIFLIVLLSGCFGESNEKIIVSDDLSNFSISDFDEKYQKMYFEKYDKCISESLSAEEWQCIAHVTGNLSLCDKWVELENNIEDRDWCLDGYYSNKMIVEEKYLCDIFIHVDMKIACEILRTKDIEKCDNLKDRLSVEICKAIIKKDNSLCNSDNCRYEIEYIESLISENIESCNKLLVKEDRVSCNAIIKNDPKLCVFYETINNCKKYSSNKVNIMRDKDNWDLGIQNLDLTYCENIENDWIKNECKNNISKIKFNMDKKDREYLDKGGNKKDISYCEMIKNGDIKKSCISIVENDIEMCKGVENELDMFFCIIQIAEIEGNFEYCNLLNSMKQECIQYFKSYFTEVV